MASEYAAAYQLCIEISKRCGCADRKHRPCASIEEMIENGEGAREEKKRLEFERRRAAREATDE